MTPKQSLTRKQSLIRRSVAALSAALLATAWAVGISTPASAAPVKGFLEIVSATDRGSGLDALVQDRAFDVVVRVLDRPPGEPNAQLLTVSKATTIVLEASGPGVLRDTTRAVIPRDGSGVTIKGATYSQYANGVKLRVRVDSGVALAPSPDFTVNVALTAVSKNATQGTSLDLTDTDCDIQTARTPNCGHLLLPKGAIGQVTMYVGACQGLAPSCLTADGVAALAVTVIAELGTLYTDTPATLILQCSKALCGGSGVPKPPVLFTFDNTVTPKDWAEADPCIAKGVLDPNQDLCVDNVQSTRNQGDLYTYLLFRRDLRTSHG